MKDTSILRFVLKFQPIPFNFDEMVTNFVRPIVPILSQIWSCCYFVKYEWNFLQPSSIKTYNLPLSKSIPWSASISASFMLKSDEESVNTIYGHPVYPLLNK